MVLLAEPSAAANGIANAPTSRPSTTDTATITPTCEKTTPTLRSRSEEAEEGMLRRIRDTR